MRPGPDEEPLYVRDPDAWREQLAEGNRTQARKRVASKVLFTDTDGRLLLVDPAYKPYWDLPGGMAEENEAPDSAAVREVREELGLDITLGQMLSVEWVAPHGPWDDLLMFVFDGGVLGPHTALNLHPQDEELRDVAWFAPEGVVDVLRSDVWQRLQRALQAKVSGSTVYTAEP